MRSGSRGWPTTCWRSPARRPPRRPAPTRSRSTSSRGSARGADVDSRPGAGRRPRRPRRLERALANLVENARRPRPRPGRITVAASRRRSAHASRSSDEGPGAAAGEAELRIRAVLAWRPRSSGSGLGLAIVRATAERHGGRSRRRGRALHDRAARSHEALRARRYTSVQEPRERTAVKPLRTRRPAALIAARSSRSSLAAPVRRSPSPRAAAAADAAAEAARGRIHDALPATAAAAASPRASTFTNGLFPSGALTGQAGSALMSGATRPPLVTNDGRGRLELQSDAGDAQITWNDDEVTRLRRVVEHRVPRDAAAAEPTRLGRRSTPPSLDEITTSLDEARRARGRLRREPTNVAGQPAYTRPVSPKHDGGLLGSAELAWDAAQRRAAARRDLRAGRDVAGARARRRPTSPSAPSRRPTSTSRRPRARRSSTSRRRLGPAGSGTDDAAGRPGSRRSRPRPASRSSPRTRSSACRASTSGSSAATTAARSPSTAQGLGAIVVAERKADAPASNGHARSTLPDGLARRRRPRTSSRPPLGTIARRGDRAASRYVVAGSVPPRGGRVRGAGARVSDAPPVEARGLVKRYGEITAVDHVDLTVERGDVFGYLGPNGAARPRRCGCCSG